MRTGRIIAAGVLIVVLFASLSWTGGYAWYWRSNRYRETCRAHLSDSLGLPAQIGRVVPRSWRSQQFDDVIVWLPDRDGQAFRCERALVAYLPDNHEDEYEIDLFDGFCEISSRTWLRPGYRRVLEQGLRPGFGPDGPRQVRFSNMSLHVSRGDFHLDLREAGGRVVFENQRIGRAAVACRVFNDCEVPTPVFLNAAFSARAEGVQVDMLELRVPPMPLAIMRLESILNTQVRSGTFEGTLVHRESGTDQTTVVSGGFTDVMLAELTGGLFDEPWQGRCPELEVNEFRVENDRPVRLRFRGVLAGIAPDDLLDVWQYPSGGGTVTLRIRQADLSPEGIDLLVASGECTGYSLEQLTAALGRGRMNGDLDVVIEDLTVQHNRLTSLAATLRVNVPDGEARWIEFAFLKTVLREGFGLDLDNLLPGWVKLPERIEYSQLGLRIEVHDEVLRVHGTHGPRDRTILTLRVGGADLPLVREDAFNPIDLAVWFEPLRERAARVLQTSLRHGADDAATADHPE